MYLKTAELLEQLRLTRRGLIEFSADGSPGRVMLKANHAARQPYNKYPGDRETEITANKQKKRSGSNPAHAYRTE